MKSAVFLTRFRLRRRRRRRRRRLILGYVYTILQSF